MKRAVIITGPGFQDHDVIYSYYRLREEGYQVDVATKGGAPVKGKYGVPLPMDRNAKPNIPFEELSANNYDAVILTGGHEAPDRVRQDMNVLAFVKEMDALGKVVGGLCHGPWIMISAQIMRGRNACAYIGMVDDMRNSGANIIDADVITDRNMVTCSYYGEVGKFMQAVFAAVEAGAGRQRQAVAA
ncbi:MAG: DJ-1/PfpI family protein [Hydrogenophilales bacterium]|nr:DJ-1/PfpI family protein [Hydrogenophilales bacterium]